MSKLAKELESDEKYVGFCKIKMFPDTRQSSIIDSNFGVFRYVYNYALNFYTNQNFYFDIGVVQNKPSKLDVHYEIRRIRKLPGNEWMKQYDLGMFINAGDEAVDAFDRNKELCKYRSRMQILEKGLQSYAPRADRTYIVDDMLRIPGLGFGSMIKLSFHTGIKRDQKIVNPRVYKDSDGYYYISFNIIKKIAPLDKPKTIPIGIDLGIINTYTTSVKINGEYFHHLPNKIEKLNKSISKLQSAIDRDINRRKKEANRCHKNFEDIPKSKRELKREKKIAKLRKYKHNIINDFEDRMTLAIVMLNPRWVCMEKFAKQKLYQDNDWTDPRMQDLHTYEIRMKMKYKCAQYGIPFYEADVNFASTKKCNICGNEYDVGKDRMYTCPHCGMIMDRDLNAAINLAKYPEKIIKDESMISLTELLDSIDNLQIGIKNAFFPEMAHFVSNYNYSYKTNIPFIIGYGYKDNISARYGVAINDDSSPIMAELVDNYQSRTMAYKVDNSKPRTIAEKIK